MVLLGAKKKQALVINKSVKTENDDNELKLKQDGNTEKEDSSSADQPPYAEIQTVTLQNIPSTSDELVEYLNLKSTLNGEYSEIKLEPADSKHTLPAKPSRQVSLSDPMSEETECGSVYQDIEQHSSTTILEQGTHIYNLHLLHIIQNSWRPLRGLSHSIIIFQKAQSRISTVVVCSSSSHCWRGLLLQMHLTLVVCNRI